METYPELQSLILSAQKGDQDTFRVLYGLLSPRIFKFIRPRVSNRDDALDALQETFIDFWRGLPKFAYAGDKALEAFLFRIASRKLSRGFRFWGKNVSLESVEDILIDESTAPEGTILDATYALAVLSAKDREVIVFRDLEDKSFPEIAQILGVSENALKVRHHRAIAKLRKKIGHE